MIIFDLALLFFVSGMLAVKSLYLGSITMVAGFLIGFQNRRTERLLGESAQVTSAARKAKAALLAIMVGACVLPLMLERPVPTEAIEKIWTEETILPVVILIGLFAAAMLAALTVEKRKR